MLVCGILQPHNLTFMCLNDIPGSPPITRKVEIDVYRG